MSIAQPSHELTNILVFMHPDVVEITEENAHYFTGLRGFCVLAYLDIFQLNGFYIYIPRPQSGKISNSNTVILKLFEGNARKCKMILTSYCSQT